MKFPKFLFGLLIGVGVGTIFWYWQKSTSAEDGALEVLDRLAKAELRVRDLEARLRLAQYRKVEEQTENLTAAVEPEIEPEVDPLEKTPENSDKKIEPSPTIPQVGGKPADDKPLQKNVAADDLQRINGIGPTFAKRLNDAGINSYNDLIQESPERLQEITGLKDWHSADPQDWINEAKGYLEN